jgi:hypothetical protein
MNGDPPRKPKSARRVAFAKWAFVGAIAGAAVISACSQPSDSQQTAQQQASDEQARKEADEKAWADAEKAGTAGCGGEERTPEELNFGFSVARDLFKEASERTKGLEHGERRTHAKGIESFQICTAGFEKIVLDFRRVPSKLGRLSRT